MIENLFFRFSHKPLEWPKNIQNINQKSSIDYKARTKYLISMNSLNVNRTKNDIHTQDTLQACLRLSELRENFPIQIKIFRSRWRREKSSEWLLQWFSQMVKNSKIKTNFLFRFIWLVIKLYSYFYPFLIRLICWLHRLVFFAAWEYPLWSHCNVWIPNCS